MSEPLSFRQAVVIVDGIGALTGRSHPSRDDYSEQAIAARVELLDHLKAALLRRPVGFSSGATEYEDADVLTALREVRSTLTVVQAVGVCRLTLQEILDRLDAIIEEVQDAWSAGRPLSRCATLRPATAGEEAEAVAVLRSAGLCWEGDEEGGAA